MINQNEIDQYHLLEEKMINNGKARRIDWIISILAFAEIGALATPAFEASPITQILMLAASGVLIVSLIRKEFLKCRTKQVGDQVQEKLRKVS
jgi:hypothetical protein